MSLIEAGARFIRPVGAFEPFVWLGFVHGHEVGFDDFLREPVASAAAVCSCVRHRTGAGAALGFARELPANFPVVWTMRVGATALWPRGNATIVYLTLGSSLGVRF